MGTVCNGNELTDSTSPLKPLGWITQIHYRIFVIAKALKKQKGKGVAKKLVAFELMKKEIPKTTNYDIVDSKPGQEVGVVNIGNHVFHLMGKGIGMGIM